MEWILSTYGAYLKIKDGLFHIKTDEKNIQITPDKIDRILITNGVFFSSDAILLAVENNIDIIFLDKYGNPQARVWHARPGSTITIKRKQLEISNKKEGIKLAKEWVAIKIKNQSDFLKELAGNRDKDKKEILLSKANILDDILIKFNENIEGKIEDIRGTIMGYEGSCGKNYFEAISKIMPSQYIFSGRSNRPAKDYFNAFLNYGYGVLYSLVEKYIMIAGMDPYIGFIHADNYNKRSLLFDLIEPYRIIVDKTVVFLFTGKKVKKECCREISEGYYLEKPGKEVLISSLNDNLDKVIHYKGKNRKARDTIQLEFHSIAQKLLKGNF